VLYSSSSFLTKSIIAKKIKADAFSTTLVQNTLGLVAGFLYTSLTMYRVIFPRSNMFWILAVSSFSIEATLIHGIGAAFNISLLWIEISAISGTQKIANVTRTKVFLLVIIVTLYVWLLPSILFGLGRLLQLVDVVYIAVLAASFALGAHQIQQLLRTPSSDQHQRSDIRRIVSTAQAVSVFSLLFSIFLGTHVYSSAIKSGVLGFFSLWGAQLTFLSLQLVVNLYLKGHDFFTWLSDKVLKTSKGQYNFCRVNKVKISPYVLSKEGDNVQSNA